MERVFTLDDVAKHSSPSDCWVVINGMVYDVTRFAPDHPGGAELLYEWAGKDASETFNSIHPPDYPEMHVGLPRGKLGAAPPPAANPTSPPAEAVVPAEAVGTDTPGSPSGGVKAASRGPDAPAKHPVARGTAALPRPPPQSSPPTASPKVAPPRPSAPVVSKGPLSPGVMGYSKVPAEQPLSSPEAVPVPVWLQKYYNRKLSELLTPKGRSSPCRMLVTALPPYLTFPTPRQGPPNAALRPFAFPSKTLPDAPGALSSSPAPFRLVGKTSISHDTISLVIALHEGHITGLHPGQHVKVTAVVGEDEVDRPYTPVSPVGNTGSVQLVVKVYRKGLHPSYPEGGVLSQHLGSLSVGDTVRLSGPFGGIVWKGKGHFTVHGRRTMATRLAMVAGGTGITPLFSIIQHILSDPADPTKIWLVYANQTDKDILLRSDLESLAARHPCRFRLWYTVDRPPPQWGYSTGFINAAMLSHHLPAPTQGTCAFLCGPPPMVAKACLPSLASLGYAPSQCHVF